MILLYSPKSLYMLGYEADKLSEFFMKTSNAAEYIKSDIQNIKAQRIYNPII